ncbi:hypothetical protein OOT33_09940 [Sphingobium sp. DEHP117]|uniref:hypothetical protein n=1 Tax=Sphingobium sp. DEHP117 TaxID=2993436 RepID=UPI0027D70AE5|nr:hypothetical protein [Sphingobium sp. DEHP117]MDQ4420751.1 hypothetical protein [Sphingobium sp. DEHP117]
MKLEQQVCSLKLAKRLKELGVKQHSLFWWDDHTEISFVEIVSFMEPDNPVCSAFTVAELGEILNNACSVKFDDSVMQSLSAINGFMVWLADINSDAYPTIDSWMEQFHELTEADARAKMLIYLIENDLIQSPFQ